MNHFAYPLAFLLLSAPFIIRHFFPSVKGLHGDALRIPFIDDIAKINIKSGNIWGISGSSSSGWNKSLWLLYLVFTLLVTAAARPQWVGEPVRLKNYSRDILMVMDISTSMLEPDFTLHGRTINRLTAVKKAAGEFIRKRSDDRIGLVLFGTRAYLQAPITYDKKSVEEILWATDAGMAGNSTSIGDALGLSLKSLKDAPNPDKKIIILLTDGENNDGSLSLPQAINLAKKEGVKIYTIGVGNDKYLQNIFGIKVGRSDLDESGLKQIAAETKGTYFRAKDTSSLQKIYNLIDEMEPSANEDKFIQETEELFYIPLIGAFVLASLLIFLSRRRK